MIRLCSSLFILSLFLLSFLPAELNTVQPNIENSEDFGCTITGIMVEIDTCYDHEYEIQVMVTYTSTPGLITVSAHGGSNFVAGDDSGLQTVTVSGLPSDSSGVTVTVQLSGGGCNPTITEIFVNEYMAPYCCLYDQTIVSGTYISADTLAATGLIESPSIVIFEATNSITLDTNFQVDLGAEMEANIVDCDNPSPIISPKPTTTVAKDQ